MCFYNFNQNNNFTIIASLIASSKSLFKMTGISEIRMKNKIRFFALIMPAMGFVHHRIKRFYKRASFSFSVTR